MSIESFGGELYSTDTQSTSFSDDLNVLTMLLFPLLLRLNLAVLLTDSIHSGFSSSSSSKLSTHIGSNLLKGSKVSSDAIEALVKAPNKVTDGLLLSQYIKGNEQKLREEFNLTQAMSNRILEWFKDSERLYELETLFPQDKIEIFLKVNEEYKVIDKLSIGQKATALLLLLFAQEDRIVILDQPEEDLDNRFIYEDVVKILREMKGERQLFIATHNANIPVLGDSELVLVLDSKNERCIINNKGSIDKEDIKTDVKNIMEGGEEAFRIRAEKYGGV